MEGQSFVSNPATFQHDRRSNLWRSESILYNSNFRLLAPSLLELRFARVATISKSRLRIWTALLLIVVVILLASGIIYYLVALPPASSEKIAGHAFFFSSGLISTNSNQGTTDELHISLQNVSNPASGMSYYGWLMSDGTETPVALGPLSINHGQIVTTYNDPNHTNLLAYYNQFLITEESTNQQPANPSLNSNDWRYAAAFPTTQNPTDPSHYSVLDHLRHLLAQDPKLEKAGLQGGLSVWLYRNTTKVLEAAGSARDIQQACVKKTSACNTDLILRQIARILDYLDGSQYVPIENIPTNIQGTQLLIDPTIAKVSLLEFDPIKQQPPGYLEHIGSHLRNLTQSPGVTSDQRTMANQINQDVNNVQGWLNAVHTDSTKLIHMSAADLSTPEASTIMNDLFNQANSAFVGQIDPNTNQVKEGVIHIYYNLQALATFNVAACIVNNGKNSCAEKDDGE